MSRGDRMHNTTAQRLIGAALVAVVIGAAFVIGYLFWPVEPQTPRRVQLVSLDAYLERALDADCIALLASKSSPGPKSKQAEECADKDTAQRKNYADLEQSIRSANAAENATYLTYLQTCVAIVGSILVVLTLCATAWAAVAASKAANAAEESVGAAVRAAEAAEAAMKNDRAWMTFESSFHHQCHDANGDISGYRFDLQWKNTGRTPAVNVVGFAASETPPQYRNPADNYVYNGGSRQVRIVDTGPGGIAEFAVTIPIEAFERLSRNDWWVFIYTRIDYHDIFTVLETRRNSEICSVVEIVGDFRVKVPPGQSTPLIFKLRALYGQQINTT